MHWELRYADGTTYSSVDGGWVDAPDEGVLWLQVGAHRLQGMDNYWMHGDFYGAFNYDHNRGWYDGPMKSRWRIRPFQKAHRILPPKTAHVVHGAMVSDSEARELNLI